MNYGIVIILECFEVVVSTNTAFCPPLTKCFDCMTLLKHFANGNLRNDAPSKLSFHFLNQNLCYKEKTTGFLQLVYFRSTRFLNRGEEKASQQWVKSYLISFRNIFLDIWHHTLFMRVVMNSPFFLNLYIWCFEKMLILL